MTTATPALSRFAQGLRTETAFDVLAVARKLKAQGKDVIELQIGDSPFNSTAGALRAGVDAIHQGATHYCPSPGLPSFRQSVARFLGRELAISVTPEEVVAAPGAKVFEQFFCEAFLDPGDAVLVFTPHFPTYLPNIERRGASTRRRLSSQSERCPRVREKSPAGTGYFPQFAAQPHWRGSHPRRPRRVGCHT